MRDPTQYVPSHVGLWTHRKFVRLVRRLAIDERIAFACLHSLWHRANAQASVDGVLRGWDEYDVADAARWHGAADALLAALLAEGWLERTEGGELVVHDWGEYAGDWRVKREMKREVDRDRQQRFRDSKRDNSAGHDQESVTTSPVTHKEKQREQSKESKESGADLAPAPAPAPAPIALKPIDPNRIEALGPYGEVMPKTVDEVVAFVHEGRPLLDRWLTECKPLSELGVRRVVERVLAHRLALEGPRLRAWFWPGGFVTKVDAWMRDEAKKELDHIAAEKRANKASAIAGEHVSAPAPQPAADRKREHEAAMRKARADLTELARSMGRPLPPPFEASDEDFRAWMRANDDVMKKWKEQR